MKLTMWQDRWVCRRMFDGHEWFDVQRGQVALVVVCDESESETMKNRVLAVLSATGMELAK